VGPGADLDLVAKREESLHCDKSRVSQNLLHDYDCRGLTFF